VNIIPVIRDLIIRNQKAVIPGFGAFVLAQRPAQLNKVTRVLTPPSVTVKFKGDQKDDDGQLTGYLTTKLRIEKSDALDAIQDFRKNTEEKLGKDEPVILEGLGTLSKKQNGEISFTPEDELLKRIGLFEMPKIDVPLTASEKVAPQAVPPRPTAPQTVPPKTTVPQTKAPPTPQPQTIAPRTIPPQVPVAVSKKDKGPDEFSYPNNRRWVVPVILLGLLTGILLVIYLTGNMGTLISDIKSSLGPDKKQPKEQLVFGKDSGNDQNLSDTVNSNISRQLDDKVDRGKALAYDENTQDEIKEPGTSKPGAAQREPAGSPVNFAGDYHVIAGSFTVSANAEKQRSFLRNKGLAAEILPKKGSFYMVSLGSYNTHGEASSVRQKLQDKAGTELWVLKNK
jgi:cell division protein FtsN